MGAGDRLHYKRYRPKLVDVVIQLGESPRFCFGENGDLIGGAARGLFQRAIGHNLEKSMGMAEKFQEIEPEEQLIGVVRMSSWRAQ